MATVPTVFSQVSRDKMAAGRLYSQLRVSQLRTSSWDYLFTEIHILNSFGSILLISGWNRMKFIQNIVKKLDNVSNTELDLTRTYTSIYLLKITDVLRSFQVDLWSLY